MFQILFVINTPPPYHGSTIMNAYLLDYFSSHDLPHIHLPVEGSKNHAELGKLKIRKIANSLNVLFGIFKNRNSYDLSYLVMSVEGFAFYRHSIFVLLLLLLKKKVILHLRCVGFGRKYGFQKLITSFIFKRSYLIQHTQRNRFDINSYAFRAVYDVPNGWPDRYAEFSTLANPTKNNLDIIFLSNLFESKGVITVLEAINFLKKDISNCKFHFIGNWKGKRTKDRFYEIIESNNLHGFIGNIGPKYNEDKYRFLANMDILLFPTYYEFETWGNVNMEAMMFKIPVIASNMVGIPDMIIDNFNGFLIEPKDFKELAEKLKILIYSAELREKFGENGRELFLNSFTLNKFEKNMLRVFNKVRAE